VDGAEELWIFFDAEHTDHLLSHPPALKTAKKFSTGRDSPSHPLSQPLSEAYSLIFSFGKPDHLMIMIY
jgi:hypothetical protein